MDYKEFMTVTGELTIELTNSLGEIIEKRFIPNLVVQVGKNFIASRIIGVASTVMSNMAIGTNAVSPTTADTTLGTEVGRVALSSSSSTTNVVTYTATFPAGTGTGAIVEAAILNAATAGTMLCRTTFSVVNKAAGDTLAISWNITIN